MQVSHLPFLDMESHLTDLTSEDFATDIDGPTGVHVDTLQHCALHLHDFGGIDVSTLITANVDQKTRPPRRKISQQG